MESAWEKTAAANASFWGSVIKDAQSANLSWWVANVGRHVTHHHGSILSLECWFMCAQVGSSI